MQEEELSSKKLKAALASALQPDEDSERRRLLVRWLNRLYFDASKWVDQFFGPLRVHDALKDNATEEQIQSFREQLLLVTRGMAGWSWREEFLYDLDRSGSVVATMDFCRNLVVLTQRFPLDFGFLREKDPEAYKEIYELLVAARFERSEVIGGVLTGAPQRYQFLHRGRRIQLQKGQGVLGRVGGTYKIELEQS